MNRKTAIYIRTSTKEQNPKQQLHNCWELLDSQEIYDIFEDQQSAWKENIEREKFEDMKKEIKKGNISKVLVWDLDRIYRNRKNLISFFQFCKAYRCKIVSYRQKFLRELQHIQEPFNDIMFDLMVQILGWLAEEESEKKSDRIRKAVKKKKKGTYSFRGKKWGRKGLPIQTIKKVWEYHEKGYSIREIAKNVRTTKKNGSMKNISKSAVHKILLEKPPK